MMLTDVNAVNARGGHLSVRVIPPLKGYYIESGIAYSVLSFQRTKTKHNSRSTLNGRPFIRLSFILSVYNYVMMLVY